MSFTCNICGTFNSTERFATEPASCMCGSNVRMRALLYMVSVEFFGQSLLLPEFPTLKTLRGIGMTDQPCYAKTLADKFDYTNTFYDSHPHFDFTVRHPELYGTCDFILSSDVIEHIAPPIEAAFEEACRLLKPNGFLALTIFCNSGDQMREHFPELYDYRVITLGGEVVLVNRKQNGALEVMENPIFHGGSGATLEMREFGLTQLKAKLLASGFRGIETLAEELPQIGVVFDDDVSQPLIARKEPFSLGPATERELLALWRRAQEDADQARRSANQMADTLKIASQSKWLRLGNTLGVGPKFMGTRLSEPGKSRK